MLRSASQTDCPAQHNNPQLTAALTRRYKQSTQHHFHSYGKRPHKTRGPEKQQFPVNVSTVRHTPTAVMLLQLPRPPLLLMVTLTFRRLMSTIVDVPQRQPLSVAFYIFIQQIWVLNILNVVYTLRFFFSSKCSLFHNSNFFGSCIIHILYTGSAKFKKIIPAPKG